MLREWRWVHSKGDYMAVRCGEEGSFGLELQKKDVQNAKELLDTATAKLVI